MVNVIDASSVELVDFGGVLTANLESRRMKAFQWNVLKLMQWDAENTDIKAELSAIKQFVAFSDLVLPLVTLRDGTAAHVDFELDGYMVRPL